MNEREERIATRLRDADQRRAEADQKAEQYEQRLAEIDEERNEQLQQARHDADEQRDRLIKQARHEVDQRREQWQQAYRHEREDLVSDLRRQAGIVATDVARQTLRQLADAELEQRMSEAFVKQIRRIDESQREEASHHLGDGTAIAVRSAFEFPEERREAVRKAIRETFESDEAVSFETSDELICGVELDVGGFSFGWNAKEFVDHVQFEFDRQLKAPRHE
jgi:F-type H+-transporting ATPase subunit b